MTKPLTAATLVPLLEILRNPENPAFAQAVQRLTTLDPSTLAPTEAPLILAQIQTVLDNLATAKTLTSEQLAALRTSGKALQSYGSR